MNAGAKSLRPRVALVIGGTAYVLAMAALATWAAWPIYRSAALLLVAAAGTVAGLLLAGAAARWSWKPWLTAAATAGAFLVLGVLLAVPSSFTGRSGALGAVGDVLMGAVTGWKDLVTVQLPIGSYRNLLVPALVVILVGSVPAAVFAWRSMRAASVSVVVALAMVMFGLGFGASVVSPPMQLGPLTLTAPRESLIGVLSLVFSLAFLAWRMVDARAGALQRAALRGGAQLGQSRSGAEARRVLLAGGMVVVAVSVALAVPTLAQSLPRDVLRSGIGPEREVHAAVSPLAQFRTFFTDETFDTTLFTVTTDPTDGTRPERVRLATLDSYDGETFRGSADRDGAPFTRVPSRLEPAPGVASQVGVEIGEYNEIWMPVVGSLASVRFAGPRSTALADAFYYNAEQSAAVEIAGGGLRAGDEYSLQVTVPEPREVASLVLSATAPVGAVAPPASLTTWMKAQDAGVDGQALAELVDRLRSRGYLSRALATPPDGEPARWMAELGEYSFQPSASGHSLARIDAMFRQLLDREAEVAAGGAGTEGGSLVAAIGDDEQFATAVVLIAQELGFSARVVVGARLEASDGLSHCTDGVCRAGDLAAWAEVQDSDGTWVPVDAAPQYGTSLYRDSQELRDPENVTELRPATAQEVAPPAPVQQDAALPPEEDTPAPLDLTLLWSVLRVVALVLLGAALVLAPFVTVIAAKVLRRRSRRAELDPAARIAGGWEEYVDAAVDRGFTAPLVLTRSELAERFARDGAPASTQAVTLAALADRAVFAHEPPPEDDAVEFWRMVDAERGMISDGVGTWQRLRAAVSLRSFARYLTPSKAVRARATEWLHERRKQAR